MNTYTCETDVFGRKTKLVIIIPSNEGKTRETPKGDWKLVPPKSPVCPKHICGCQCETCLNYPYAIEDNINIWER